MRTRSRQTLLPDTPTNALPGSPEKVRILAERVRSGVSLWHPLDARLPGDLPLAGAPPARDTSESSHEVDTSFCLAS